MRVDPQLCFQTSLQAYLGATFASETIHVVTGAQFTCTCYSIASCLPRAYLGPTFADEQIVGFIAMGLPTRDYPGPTLADEQIIGLPWAYLCQRAHHWVYCSGPTRADIGPTFANEQTIGFVALGLLGPTLGLSLPTSKSLVSLLWAF